MAGDTASGVRPGTVTAAVAAFGLLLGGWTGYSLSRQDSTPRIILRQANSQVSSLQVRGNGPTNVSGFNTDVQVLIVNDSTVTVEIEGTALAGRTPPAGSLSETIDLAPGNTAVVFVSIPTPNRCGNVAMDSSHSVKINVFARLPGGVAQSLPVQVTGPVAEFLAGCAL